MSYYRPIAMRKMFQFLSFVLKKKVENQPSTVPYAY